MNYLELKEKMLKLSINESICMQDSKNASMACFLLSKNKEKLFAVVEDINKQKKIVRFK